MNELEFEVSVIVPTRNEEQNLPLLLNSLRVQDGVRFETIIVDQESDDSTPKIASDTGARVITQPRPAFYSPPAQSRNAGAREASGRILLHLDADMELPDSLFMKRVMSLIDDEHEAAIIHEHDVAEGWWNKVKAVERACYWNTPLESARAVTKRLFDEIGGYDEAISSGEDMHIHHLYSQRTQIARADDVWLHHHTGRIPLSRLLAKKFSYGKTAATFLRHSRGVGGHSSRSWVRESLAAYASHLDIGRQKPLEFACILPLRLMELVALRMGVRRATQSRATT